MKRKLLFLPLIAVLFSLSACNQNADNNYALYKRYLANTPAEEQVSYEDWLAMQKGEKGDDAEAPNIVIGDNGHFFIDNKDTGVTAKGQKGDKGDTGDDSITPYEQYKAAHSDYQKSEDEFYNDLANGLLGEHIYHTVSFNSDGGNEIESQQVLHGEKASKPLDPVKEGFVFKCWTYEGDAWSFIGMPVIEDMTLVAVWEADNL